MLLFAISAHSFNGLRSKALLSRQRSGSIILGLCGQRATERDDKQIRSAAGLRNHNIFVIKPRLQPSPIGHLS